MAWWQGLGTSEGKPVREFVEEVNTKGPQAIISEYKDIVRQDKLEASPAFDKNGPLNRWKDIVCFESSRVVLRKAGNDYIHANYVDGYQQQKKFICTQGPMRRTMRDFWRMIWQEGTTLIVALTKIGGPKCDLYFPDTQGKAVIIGDYKLQNLSVVDVDNAFNHIQVMVAKRPSDGKSKSERRTVTILLYHDWPDKGTPNSSSTFLQFIDRLNAIQVINTQKAQADNSWTGSAKGPPIVVHCSAGVGRTGTLVALDIIIERMKENRNSLQGAKVEIRETVLNIRKQRHVAVQRPEQYIFLYLAAVEYAVSQSFIDPHLVDVSLYMTTVHSADRIA